MVLTAGRMMLVAWTTSILYSGDMSLPPVGAGKQLIMIVVIAMLQSRMNDRMTDELQNI
jgi:hypothetical protein